ncbi:MAG: hypothetical protein K1X36_13720 [Pyrinomonadaceae bacterium]|nr:hypothetical protein [Pyrinomonadaceae bacterium]
MIAAIMALASAAAPQNFPKKIRGYKVHKAKIDIVASGGSTRPEGSDGAVSVGSPTLVDIGISGIVLDVDGSFTAVDQSGSIDFLTFNDLRVNGISVAADEYRHSFSFSKNELTKLPSPVRVRIGTLTLARAAYREYVSSTESWKVTGTVLAFGRFRKFGMSFKRVVPINISLLIENPIPAALRN